jgi:hypothetical protein
VSKQLSAAEYREALALVLAELENLPIDALEKAERLGRLEAHIATVIGTRRPRTDPVYGLHMLRRSREEAPIDQS